MTGYVDDQYTPSKFLLDTIKPKIDSVKKDLKLHIYDSTLYDFKTVHGFSDYWNKFTKSIDQFNKSLVILSYNSEKYIPRDCYVASLTKRYTKWDVVYINCDCPEKITSNVFNDIIKPDELPESLTKLIEKKYD